MSHLLFLLFLALFSSARADDTKVPSNGLPVLVAACTAYSVSLTDGTLGGPVFCHGLRTIVPLPNGWSSVQEARFFTGATSFQPSPAYAFDFSHQVLSSGLRLGLAGGLRYTPSYDGADDSFSVSAGPVMIKPLNGFGVAVVFPFGWNLETEVLSVGVAFVMAFKVI